ncbi:hypothetical protein Fot_04299 [Forsythia ovata]|uniref:Secreted protein n=1 Tax=Forsythia ovata TaxID=205694 RepID=A0ABD1XC55_9LAMI
MPRLQMFSCLLWVFWQERNCTLHGSSSRSTSILLAGLEYMFGKVIERKEAGRRPQEVVRSQHMKACDRREHGYSSSGIPGATMVKWQALRVHSLKLNTDAAIRGGSGQIGTGRIIQDHH